MALTRKDWPHYDDLPYEVVVVRTLVDGTVEHEELVSRHSLSSEAAIHAESCQRAIVDPKHFSAYWWDSRRGV